MWVSFSDKKSSQIPARTILGYPSTALGHVRLETTTVDFTGTRASEVRPGYATLQIPPLENWEEPLRWLSRTQRERFEEPDFYEMLQRENSSRLLKLPANR